MTVYGTDLEANGVDVYCVGRDNDFIGIKCATNFTFGTSGIFSATRNKIVGGLVDKIIFEAGTLHNKVDTTFNISGAGLIGDSGSFNRTKGSFDAVGSAYYARARSTLTVSASPYSFQNTTGDNLLVSISGGTVSAVDLQPQATGAVFSSGLTSGTFELAPKDIIRITYTVAPTINQWGI
jgi:hypothetical protein